jgi:hypothetical protein
MIQIDLDDNLFHFYYRGYWNSDGNFEAECSRGYYLHNKGDFAINLQCGSFSTIDFTPQAIDITSIESDSFDDYYLILENAHCNPIVVTTVADANVIFIDSGITIDANDQAQDIVIKLIKVDYESSIVQTLTFHPDEFNQHIKPTEGGHHLEIINL